MKAPTPQQVMDSALKMARDYKAEMKPKDGIIKFILPKEDRDNPTDIDVQIEINTLNNSIKMSYPTQ